MPDITKPPASYQVLDATTGQRTRQFSILEKREFRRLPWIVRFLQQHHLVAHQTPPKVLLSPEEQNKLIHRIVQEIQELDDPTTFQQVLRPIFAIAETKCDSDKQRFMLTLFSEVLTLLMEKSTAFLQRAQQKETELGHRDHYRALTNYWVCLIIGTIYKEDSTIIQSMPPDDSAYAYSFLYPYSDDLLDGNEVTAQQKKVFCQNIATKIMGGSLKQLAFDSTENHDVLQRECRVYQLVDQVLLSDTSSHALRESLCAINHAQLASMKQHVDSQDIQATVKCLSKQEEAQIFEISVNKGVASVMPDAYFCHPNGSLTKEQAELVAMVGAIGQFMNDIEGLFDDLHDKSLTPALISYLKHGSLDRFLEKCLTYIGRQSRCIPNKYPSLNHDRVQLLMHMIKLRLLIAAAILDEANPESHVLSPGFCRGLKDQLGVDMSTFALLGRLEREVFGNLDTSRRPAHQLSSPKVFRQYILSQAEQIAGCP